MSAVVLAPHIYPARRDAEARMSARRVNPRLEWTIVGKNGYVSLSAAAASAHP